MKILEAKPDQSYIARYGTLLDKVNDIELFQIGNDKYVTMIVLDKNDSCYRHFVKINPTINTIVEAYEKHIL